MSACVHELDVVRLLRPAAGWAEPDGRSVTLPAGTLGTVVSVRAGKSWLVVEADDEHFADVRRREVEVVTPHRPEVESAA